MSYRDEYENLKSKIENIRQYAKSQVGDFSNEEADDFLQSLDDILTDTLEGAAAKFYREYVQPLDEADAAEYRASVDYDYRMATQ